MKIWWIIWEDWNREIVATADGLVEKQQIVPDYCFVGTKGIVFRELWNEPHYYL